MAANFFIALPAATAVAVGLGCGLGCGLWRVGEGIELTFVYYRMSDDPSPSRDGNGRPGPKFGNCCTAAHH